MKRAFKVLAVLLVIWLGVTFYFINQHSVVGKEVKLNKTVVFDDLTIELYSTVFYNFKRKETFNPDYEAEIKKFKYKLLARLPDSLHMPYSRISYLYRSPFEIEKSYTIALFGKCKFTQHVNDSTEYNEFREYNDYFKDYLSIYMEDSIGVDYSNGVRTLWRGTIDGDIGKTLGENGKTMGMDCYVIVRLAKEATVFLSRRKRSLLILIGFKMHTKRIRIVRKSKIVEIILLDIV